MDERLGKLQFWMTFIGFHGTFLIQHWLGNEGMPRRYVDYLASDGFTTLNMISTIFSFVLGASIIPFLYNVTRSWKYGRLALRRRPVGPRQLAGVGDLVPAAAAQLPGDPADPVGAAGVRGALPGPHRAAAGRGARRQGATRPTRTTCVDGRDRPATGPAGPRRDLTTRTRRGAQGSRASSSRSSKPATSDVLGAVGVERLADHGRGQPAVVALAGQHAHQPPGRRRPVEPAHRRHLAVDQAARGGPFVVVVDGRTASAATSGSTPLARSSALSARRASPRPA